MYFVELNTLVLSSNLLQLMVLGSVFSDSDSVISIEYTSKLMLCMQLAVAAKTYCCTKESTK